MNETDKWNFYSKVFRPMLSRSLENKGVKQLYYEVWIDLDETYERWFDFMYKYPNLAIGTISRWLIRRDKWYWSDDYVTQLNKAMETQSAEEALTTVLKKSLVV